MDTISLGPLERRAMSHLWQVGAATVAEVRDALNSSGERALAYTTVMTVLVRLDEKGFVDRTLEGRQYRYVAAFPEDALQAEIGRRELNRLIGRHGAESLAAFAADLVGTDADLTRRLRELADQDTEA
jgi:predicted transcriptional regulator